MISKPGNYLGNACRISNPRVCVWLKSEQHLPFYKKTNDNLADNISNSEYFSEFNGAILIPWKRLTAGSVTYCVRRHCKSVRYKQTAIARLRWQDVLQCQVMWMHSKITIFSPFLDGLAFSVMLFWLISNHNNGHLPHCHSIDATIFPLSGLLVCMLLLVLLLKYHERTISERVVPDRFESHSSI